MIRTRIFICAILVAVCICFTNVQADPIPLDLTEDGFDGYINGAYFQQADEASTGTGLIQSFVRIQAKGVEMGYNTDYRPFTYDELNSSTFTHSLLLEDVPTVKLDGISYREFLLDINQTKPNSLLSLDALKIYQGDTGDRSGPITSWTDNPIYDMGEDNYIKLDYSLNNGSGSGDMFAYIPESMFDDKIPYVYLYSEFGAEFGANAGPEEWAVRMIAETTTGTVVPVPAAVLLGMLGLGVMGLKLRKFA